MKKLTITTEQKNLLLIMAKKLFSEYDNVSVKAWHQGRVRTTTEGIKVGVDSITLPYKDMGNVDPFIGHKYFNWLEFCLFELAERVFNPNPLKPHRGLHVKFNDFYWNCNLYWDGKDPKALHPVEYLYNIFKTVK